MMLSATSSIKVIIIISLCNLINEFFFSAYKALPFIFEMVSILDWTVTKTALNLFMWMKLEDAYSNLYMDKCDMVNRKKHPLGKTRGRWEKCLSGCLFTAFLVIIIILPIALFSTL